jgi:hypothetical protein
MRILPVQAHILKIFILINQYFYLVIAQFTFIKGLATFFRQGIDCRDMYIDLIMIESDLQNSLFFLICSKKLIFYCLLFLQFYLL